MVLILAATTDDEFL